MEDLTWKHSWIRSKSWSAKVWHWLRVCHRYMPVFQPRYRAIHEARCRYQSRRGLLSEWYALVINQQLTTVKSIALQCSLWRAWWPATIVDEERVFHCRLDFNLIIIHGTTDHHSQYNWSSFTSFTVQLIIIHSTTDHHSRYNWSSFTVQLIIIHSTTDHHSQYNWSSFTVQLIITHGTTDHHSRYNWSSLTVQLIIIHSTTDHHSQYNWSSFTVQLIIIHSTTDHHSRYNWSSFTVQLLKPPLLYAPSPTKNNQTSEIVFTDFSVTVKVKVHRKYFSYSYS